MRHLQLTPYVLLTAAVLVAPLAGLTHAALQEKAPLTPDDMFNESSADPRQRMIELFHEIENTLFVIADDLAEAGAGGPLGDVGDSGIDKLLDQVGSQGQAVTKGIDELLELAQQMGNPSMQSSMNSKGEPQQGPKPGESPLDQPRSNSPTQGEETPEGPRPDGQEGQQPDGQQPGQQQEGESEQPKPEPGGEKPGDQGENPDDGENRAGEDDGRRPGDPTAPSSDSGDWGHLPARTQQVFRNQGGEELPIQYRDWIDSYYRRLNRAQ